MVSLKQNNPLLGLLPPVCPIYCAGLGREIWSTNDKQFVRCDQEGCTKILTDPSSLYRHKKIHTRDKQHICALCEARFIQR